MSGKRLGRGGMGKGMILTLDMSIAVLLMFLVFLLAMAYFAKPAPSDFEGVLLRNAMEDAVSVMEAQGYFYAPLLSEGNSNTSGIRSVLRALPPSVCMQVSAYGIEVPEGLLGYWKLDEEGGTFYAIDSSRRGNSGFLSGSFSSQEDGRAGRALVFDGTTSAANLTDSDDFNPRKQSFSIAFWVNASGEQASDWPVIIAKQPQGAEYPGYSIDIPSIEIGGIRACYYSSVDSCNDGGGEVYSDGRIVGTGWHHVAAVFDRTENRVMLYVDGVLQMNSAEGFSSAGSIANEGALYIGARFRDGAFTQHFTGALDDVRFYGRALSPQEVKRIYSNSNNLLYSVHKEGCTYRGGNAQMISTMFSNPRQEGGHFVVKAIGWLRGE
ncbi:MAG: LamG domain-containing protein [Candidatus Micrarchaeota archaeon]|nr:LamG domain-containing protein [Candidatus Micrarchaeota archaeon]